jgi:hypothetical protein
MKLATGVKLDEFKGKCYHAIFFASTGIDLLFFTVGKVNLKQRYIRDLEGNLGQALTIFIKTL